jgi:hypothetical protein
MRTIKTNYLLLAAMTALTIGMTSCSQSEDMAEDTTGKQTITFTSGDDETTTRTSMGGNYTASKFPFYWEKGDAIWINAKDHITGDNTSTAAHANFTGSVSTSAPYYIRYTGTGSYSTTNSRTGITVSTTSDANTLVIPPLQSIASWAEGAATSRIGANGDCGTATATGSGSSYKFKLDHKAAYLIIMPRWGTGGTNTTYKLKSVTVTTHDGAYLLSGRFSFSDSGIGNVVTNTGGSATIKITTGGSTGIVLPTSKDQTQSINIAIKPIATAIPLYCIYEISDGTNKYYIEKIISEKTYAANTVTPVTADIKKGYDMARLGQDADGKSLSSGPYLDVITNKNPYSGFYDWDVPNGEEHFVSHEMADDYNGTSVTVGTPTAAEGARTDWCTNSNFNALPTYNQITWYLKGGCYWDADKKWGPADNQKGGMWFKKKAYLISSGVVTETAFNTTQSGITTSTPVTMAPADFNTSDWFFLPAAGYLCDGTLYITGTYGYDWSSTPSSSVGFAYSLFFYSGYAGVGYNGRNLGFCLWSVR